MLNITSAARYITSNSGGSWLNAAFSFQDKVPLSAFLGPYIPPQQLTQQRLQQADASNGSFASVIANAGIFIPGAAGVSAVLNATGVLNSVSTVLLLSWAVLCSHMFVHSMRSAFLNACQPDSFTFQVATVGLPSQRNLKSSFLL
jgi:hypothetical protein